VPPTTASLAATPFLDYHSPAVTRFVADALRGVPPEPVPRAVALYYAVRDGIRYEIYGADLSRDGIRASRTAAVGSGLCLHKSVLYAAGLRSLGIPCRLILADVRNHLSSPRIQHLLGGDVFHHHCLTTVYLDGRWVKATPVFNRALCRLYGIEELDFDGSTDSAVHPYDLDNHRHMQFLRTHGEFDDLPYDRVITDLRAAHPDLFAGPDDASVVRGSLIADATA
jgi:transglutaminase-like putative cysteine protease